MSWLSSALSGIFGNHSAPQFGGVTSLVKPTTGYTAAPTTPTGGLATGDASGSGGGGIDWGAILKGIGNYAPLGLAALQALSSAKEGSAASKQIQDAIDLAKQRDAALQPLRDAGTAGALKAYQTPVTAYQAENGYQDAGNPYMRALAGAPTPMTASPVTGVVPLVHPTVLRRGQLRNL